MSSQYTHPPPAPRTPERAALNGYSDRSPPPDNSFVTLPNTPMAQHQQYYDNISLQSHSPYSILKDNYLFWLQQTWRTRIGLRLVVLISSVAVVGTSGYVMNTYSGLHEAVGGQGGLWRNGPEQGGIDMSPVVVLLAVGTVVLCFSFILMVGSWVPALRPITNTSDILTATFSTISVIASIAAVAYTFNHPSLSVDFASPSPISFRKWACNIKILVFGSAPATGDPLDGVDGRAVVKFTAMCGQFNLSWVMAVVVVVFEMLVLISVPLGRKWRRGLEEVERSEEKLSPAGKYVE